MSQDQEPNFKNKLFPNRVGKFNVKNIGERLLTLFDMANANKGIIPYDDFQEVAKKRLSRVFMLTKAFTYLGKKARAYKCNFGKKAIGKEAESALEVYDGIEAIRELKQMKGATPEKATVVKKDLQKSHGVASDLSGIDEKALANLVGSMVKDALKDNQAPSVSEELVEAMVKKLVSEAINQDVIDIGVKKSLAKIAS